MRVDPTAAELEKFVSESPDEPFVMLNLVRYVPDGQARYTEYLKAAAPLVEKAGARVLYFGAGRTSLVAPDLEDWDAALLVWYPSPAAFAAMAQDPEYAEVSQLRTGALAAAVLQPTRPLG